MQTHTRGNILMEEKAAEDRRTPGCWRDLGDGLRVSRSVLECASPLALWNKREKRHIESAADTRAAIYPLLRRERA